MHCPWSILHPWAWETEDNVVFCPGLLQNLQLVENLEALAAKKGCTVGQLALAWVRLLNSSLAARQVQHAAHPCSTLDTLPPPGLRRCWRGAKT